MGTDDSLSAEAVFSVVPEWVIYHPEITDKALRLYCVLARYTNKGKTAFPSRLTLANHMGGCTRITVDRALDVLEAIGAVEVGRRKDKDNPKKNLTNLYTLKVAPPMLPPGNVGVARGSNMGVTQNENHSEREPLSLAVAAPAEWWHNIEPPSPGWTPTATPHAWFVVGGNRRDLLAEQVAHECRIQLGDMTKSSRGALNRALSELREAGASPSTVAARVQVYRAKWPDVTLTPSALAKHWPQLLTDVERRSIIRIAEPHRHAWQSMNGDDRGDWCACGEWSGQQRGG